MSTVTVRLTFCSKIQLAHIIVTHIYTCIGIIFCIQIKIRNLPLVAYFFYMLIIRFKITFGVICKRIVCNNKPYFRVRKIISNFKKHFFHTAGHCVFIKITAETVCNFSKFRMTPKIIQTALGNDIFIITVKVIEHIRNIRSVTV